MNSEESFFPTDPKKIRTLIRRYERAFNKPHYDDGPGKRFLLGPLYLLMGDAEGALKSYGWYKKAFPDDVPEAFNHLCWILVLLKSGDLPLAERKLRELVFDNFYLVPVFLGENPGQHDFQHGSNWRELAYVLEGPCDEMFSLWTDSERAWLKKNWDDPKLQADLSRYIELYKELDRTNGYEERGELLRQASLISKV